jgi:hypothetical protein
MYANGACTVGLVINNDSTNSPAIVFGEGSSASDTPIYSPAVFASLGNAGDLKTLYRTDAGVTVINYTDTIAGSVDDAVCLVIDDGSSIVTTKNGGSTVTAVASYSRATTTLNRFAVGGLLRTSFYNAIGWAGDVAEIVIADSAIGSADREKLEGYLAHKWGLESNLPSTHPYKSSAP